MSSRYCTSVLWGQLHAQGWSDALLFFWQQGLSWVFRSCNSFFQTLLLPCKILDNIHLQNNDIRQYMLIIVMAKLSVSGNQSDTTLSWKACTPSVKKITSEVTVPAETSGGFPCPNQCSICDLGLYWDPSWALCCSCCSALQTDTARAQRVLPGHHTKEISRSGLLQELCGWGINPCLICC